MNTNVRDAAFISLERIERGNKYSNLEIDSSIKKFNLTPLDRGLYTNLVYGVIEKKITLDHYISKFSSKQFNTLDESVITILRMGIYQIIYLDRIPDNAACNESVELCKRHGSAKASGFVNAVLREICRSRDKLEDLFPDSGKYPEKYLSVRYSLREWLCEMWMNDYGFEKTESILRVVNTQQYPTLRVNTLRITREELLARLKEKNIEAAETARSASGIRLQSNYPISEFDEIKEGLCYIQDEASQICGEICAVEPGEIFLDVCSAPGGKSFNAAINMRNQGRVMSFDIHKNKLSLIERSAKLLGLDIIETREKNASIYDAALKETADCVLCDVPCSGLGVIAKKPEIRYKDRDEIERLPRIQSAILSNSSEYVKLNGRLIYSTCTLNSRENIDVVKKFLSENDDFKLIHHETLFPDTDDTDGFFIAKMIKIK